jgi:crotonobetainyl-CoA:carnitine CoA-transferase CaiB-like acyl-CoA transferase
MNAALGLGDPRFEPGATQDSIRSERALKIFEKMKDQAEEQFASRTSNEILKILEAQDIACAPVLNLLNTFDSEHLKANRYVVDYDHPSAGKTTLLGHPIRFEKTPMRIKHPAEPVGARGEEILRGLAIVHRKFSACASIT